jgi:site-specific DNA recombinase
MRHNIGIYLRVSTEEQAQIADGSIDSQQHRINAFIEMKKHQDKHWGKVVDTYVDDGYSAGSTNRPAYQRMISDLKNGKINLLLVTDLSRLSRNISDFCDLYKQLGKYKANFLSIKEQFDTSTPIGEMMVFNMVNLAQFERKQTSERISMNFHSRALRGLVNGGNPLLGYDRDPSNPGKRIVNEAEAILVRKIFQMYDEGQSQSSIAEQLTKEGEKRKDWNGRKYRHIKDGRWTLNAIQNILKNYAYVGKREVNVGNKKEKQEYLKAWQQYQIVPASWEPIIDEAKYIRVQKRMAEAYKMERTRFSNGKCRTYLVSGKIKCGHCGMALIGQSAHGKNKVHRYYGHKQLAGETINCPVKRYPANEIERVIIKHLDIVLNESRHLDNIESNIEKSMGTSKLEMNSKKETILRAIEKVDGEIDSILKLVTNMKSGSAGFEVIQEKLQKLAEKKKELEKGLNLVSQVEDNLGVMEGAKKFIETNALRVKESIKKAKPYLQKKLLSELFQQLIATDAGLKVFYHLPENKNFPNNDQKTKKAPGLIPGALQFLNQISEFFSAGNLPSHCVGGGGGN